MADVYLGPFVQHPSGKFGGQLPRVKYWYKHSYYSGTLYFTFLYGLPQTECKIEVSCQIQKLKLCNINESGLPYNKFKYEHLNINDVHKTWHMYVNRKKHSYCLVTM